MARVLRVNEADNVVIAVAPIKSGTVVREGDTSITVRDDIPMGHKIAVRGIPAGADVIRYGNPIGHAKADIASGQWVHVHNIKTNLSDIINYQYRPEFKEAKTLKDPVEFQGYRRPDGQVGIRNEIWVIPTVFCANGPAQRIAELANQEFARSGNFDGVYCLTHPNGCSQVGDDLLNTQRILANLANHPNAAGVLLISLGCEVNCFDSFLPVLGGYDVNRVKLLQCQEVEDEIAEGLHLMEQLVNYAQSFKREPVPVSELVIAVNCGGSDAFSGLTANAVVGKVTDRLTQLGGTVIMTEVPEMFGAEHLLMNRAENVEVFNKIVHMINDYKAYFKRYGQQIYENPTQGNLAGGISTLEEKSLGCIQKGGQAVVRDVLAYGERVAKHGFNLISGPGNDLVGITNQEAAGAVLTIFTTGRGTPAGFATPLIRLSSNSTMAQKKENWIDVNAGMILEGSDFEAVADQLFDLVVKVASGKTRTKSEAQGYRQIGMLRDGVTN